MHLILYAYKTILVYNLYIMHLMFDNVAPIKRNSNHESKI